jgi:WhiB family redox-sensing transcriptional regulator
MSTGSPWMNDAACKGRTHLFFAPPAERPQARVRREAAAKKVCESCPVRGTCRMFARDNLEYGVWGGETELERLEAGYPLPAAIGARQRRTA